MSDVAATEEATLDRCAMTAERLDSALSKPSWKPSRAHVEGARNDLVWASERIVELENAFGLALNWLIKHEPPDSRAVSDEFVAMSAIQAGFGDAECSKIVARALVREMTLSLTSTKLDAP
jgi:hypothetical protein